MNVHKLHNVTKQNSYIGQIAAASCNLVTKLQFCLFLQNYNIGQIAGDRN